MGINKLKRKARQVRHHHLRSAGSQRSAYQDNPDVAQAPDGDYASQRSMQDHGVWR
jgi:hypothetical protein